MDKPFNLLFLETLERYLEDKTVIADDLKWQRQGWAGECDYARMVERCLPES